MTGRITVIGAGAIGGVAGAWLSAAGHEVLLVDIERAHVEEINRSGLRISGIRGDRTFRLPACLPEALHGPLGFVILAVKAQHTEAALAPVAELLVGDGFVVSMQNGLNEELISRRVGAGRTIGCFVHFGADYQAPGHILLAGEHPIYVGELDGAVTGRLSRIAGTLGAVMPVQITDHIWDWLWTKMCYGSLYFAGALVDRPLPEVLQRPQYRPALAALVAEAVHVARGLGHGRLEQIGDFRPAAFAGGHTAEASAVFDALAARQGGSLKIYTGIQRDIMVRRRRTEVDHQPGAVIERADQLGIAVPYHRAVVRMIKEIEAGRRAPSWPNLDELAAVVPARTGGDA